MIGDYVLHKKSNTGIQAKFSLVYGKNALSQRTVDTCVARLWSGRLSLEGDDRLGRPSGDSLSDAVSGYLNINSPASYREIAKNLFIPMIIILPVLDERVRRFFVAR
jgi:hypothetical protein